MSAERTPVATRGNWTWYIYSPEGTSYTYLEKRNGKARVSKGKFKTEQMARDRAKYEAM